MTKNRNGRRLNTTLHREGASQPIKIEQIAEICHEANRVLCIATGDNSQPSWSEAPDWQRESAINGVKFHLANPDASASHTHEEWLREKLATNWKYGTVKNPETKEHPCIVPFEELPEEEQAKDYLFQSIVRGLSRFVTAPSPSDFV